MQIYHFTPFKIDESCEKLDCHCEMLYENWAIVMKSYIKLGDHDKIKSNWVAIIIFKYKVGWTKWNKIKFDDYGDAKYKVGWPMINLTPQFAHRNSYKNNKISDLNKVSCCVICTSQLTDLFTNR